MCEDGVTSNAARHISKVTSRSERRGDVVALPHGCEHSGLHGTSWCAAIVVVATVKVHCSALSNRLVLCHDTAVFVRHL